MADKKKNPVTEGKKSFNWPDKIFGAAVLILSILVFLIIAYPLWFIIIASISNSNMVNLGKVTFLPKDIRFYGYQQIMDDARIWMGYANTILYVVAGTILNMAVTMPAAYALSRRNFKARNKVMFYFVFTMFFSGGMIPTYMLIRSLHMLDSIWSMVIPGAVGVYNLIIARTFIKNSIPGELLDAAKIDGCSDIKYFTMIVLPLSKAIIAVLVLFYGVGHWNSYFNPMLYLNSRELFSLPIFLKEILIANQIDPSTVTDPELQMQIAQIADVIKYALIVVSTIPVLVIYPFIQKYFVKGVMIGSVKG